MPKVSDEHLASRRQQITDAASQLFAERGFSRTTMADIVSASGLSTGAVYRYFASKSELVRAVVAGRDGTVEGEFVDESPSAAVTRLAGYVSAGEGSAHARLVAQIWGEAAVLPDLAAVVRSTHERLQGHLLSRMASEAGARRTSSDEGAATAQVILAALVGLSALVASDVPVDERAFVATLLRLLDD